MHLDHLPPALNALPLLSFAERAEIQRQGAKAAARGEPADANPLSQSRNKPSATGESTDRWLQRSAAWQQGHAAQTAARRKVQLPPAREDGDEHD
jgi:hypothetical protein